MHESLPVRDRGVLRADRYPAAGDDLGHDLRQRPHPLGAADRGVLLLGLALRRALRRDELRRRGRSDARADREPLVDLPDPRQLPSQCRHARRVRRLPGRPGPHGRHPGRVRPERLAEHRRRLLRHDARTGSRPSAGPSTAFRRARSPSCRTGRPTAAWSRWSSGPRPTSS